MGVHISYMDAYYMHSYAYNQAILR